MIFYLTYNDPPSGVYWSQVTDVVEHLNSLGDERVRLVALISLRGFMSERRRIRRRIPDAIVLPMLPRARNWRLNATTLALLCRVFRPSGLVGRGVFATALGLRMRGKGLLGSVCFDARAAYAAEWEEFRLVDDARLVQGMADLEREVLNEADLRTTVSHALVAYWRERYGYPDERHVVIPCTLTSDMDDGGGTQGQVRRMFGWGEDDLVLVYSGTVVGWQSMELLRGLLDEWLAAGPVRRVLFLSEEHPAINGLAAAFPEQVGRLWVPHEKVHAMLVDCDHGLLLRRECVTNRVASPTKFAEYLGAGLPVIISEGVGDLSGLVRDRGLGLVLGHAVQLRRLVRPSQDERQRSREAAEEVFTKKAYDREYRQVLRHMGRQRTLARENMVAPDPQAPGILVSIIVPGFNKVRYLDEMIASVQAQTHAGWEMIFVDDASTDGTREAIMGRAAEDSRIKPVLQQANVGANRCRNVGMALAKGDYLMFLDADDVLAPHCLERRISFALQGDHDMVVSSMEVFQERPGDGAGRWAPSPNDPLDEFLRHHLPWSVMQPLWRRSFLLSLGGFDERFPRHQDVEFHTRALFRTDIRYATIEGAPDCFYRIAEQRKVLRPYELLDAYTTAALLYYHKFREQATRTGRGHLLFGTIYRTHVQILHGRKVGWVDGRLGRELISRLMGPDILRSMGPWRRLCFSTSAFFNTLPVRIPGVNLVLYRLVTL